MIDINSIREQADVVKSNMKLKNQDPEVVDDVKKADEQWRKLKVSVDSLRAERNTVSKQISEAKKSGKKVDAPMKRAKAIPGELDKIERKLEDLQKKIAEGMLVIPNIMHKDVPKGKDDSDNVEIRKVGRPSKAKVMNHVELLEKAGLIDFDASAKVAGNGFYYMKKDLALLNQALIRFGIDFMNKKKYDYIEGPLMLHNKALYASMDKAAIEESVYTIVNENLGLIGTSEQSLLSLHAGETLSEEELPKKYFSYSMCFRKEIGSHGINEKGLWRTHQFNKIEQFVFCKPEDSEKIYAELLKNTEEIIKTLELPYRVIELCSADLADWKHRSHDIEVWRPTTQDYGEIGSLSNCTDYQARKLNIKAADKKGNKRVVHTLNNTALATSRILVAIIENHQNKDGSITIPKVLVPYMYGKKKIEVKA